MSEFVDYIKKWFAAFVAIATIVGFFAVFGDFQGKVTLGQAIIGSLVVISVIAFIWKLIAQRSRVYNHISKEKIENRTGYQKSKDMVYSDSTHKFELVHRRDYLHIGIGNYFSIRHLRGRNISRKASDGIIYYEGMDIKTKHTNVQFEAIDLRTDRSLQVVNCSGNNHPKFFLAFKIIFETPIKPQESFDIQFSIFIKDEVKHLGAADEFMSVSLRRFLKGVENLVFDIALNIHPEHRCCFKENIFGEAVFFRKNNVESTGIITQDTDIFSRLSSKWFKRGFMCEKDYKRNVKTVPEEVKLHVFTFKKDQPQKTVYAIHFMNKIDSKGDENDVPH